MYCSYCNVSPLGHCCFQIPETVFEKVLYNILEDELTAAFSTPGQLYLLLVGIQKFPKVLGPEKLKALLGTTAVVTAQNIPRSVKLMKHPGKPFLSHSKYSRYPSSY